MIFKYEVRDGREVIAKGSLLSTNDLTARKKLSKKIREHYFKNGMKVFLADSKGKVYLDIDTKKSELHQKPVAKKLQGMPSLI